MKLLLILTMLGLSACSLVQRSAGSGYDNSGENAYDVSAPDIYQQRQAELVSEAEQELGFEGGNLSEAQAHAVALRVRLKEAEAQIPTRREKEQYYGLKGNLRTDRARLYFLSLPSFEARQSWAKAHGYLDDKSLENPQVADAIQNNDILLGMTQKAVTQSWGNPDHVEVAGNPMYGYQRWTYNRYVSGNDGYEKQRRIVYFESGRVVGWEQH